MKRIGLAMVATAVAALFYGCGGTGSDPDTTELTLEFTDLPALGAGSVYEGWLITPDGPVSTGRFTVADDGAVSQSGFDVDASVAAEASTFVLTIEPETGDDPGPADTHLLAGDLANDSATLTIAHPAALGDDFTGATGEYILAAPTGGEGTPFEYGIWFFVPGEAPAAGLSLPTLPAGWAYEGWVASETGPISTGQFTDPADTDWDGAGPDAGPDLNAAPPFPGQDFVDPARDLTDGYTAVVSVEPQPDDSPAPFILKPLVHEIGSVMPPTTQTMNNNAAATSPSGTATLTL